MFIWLFDFKFLMKKQFAYVNIFFPAPMLMPKEKGLMLHVKFASLEIEMCAI